MKIYSDLELNGVEFSEKGKLKMQSLKDFIYDRLKVLETQIEKEAGTIIFIMTNNPGLEFRGFSPSLIKKMKDSLTEDDFRYFLTTIS